MLQSFDFSPPLPMKCQFFEEKERLLLLLNWCLAIWLFFRLEILYLLIVWSFNLLSCVLANLSGLERANRRQSPHPLLERKRMVQSLTKIMLF